MNNITIPFYEHKTELIYGIHSEQFDYPPHLHGCPELVRINAGTLKMQINTQKYLVTKGQLAVIFPNVIHSYEVMEKDTIIDGLICGHDPNNGFPSKFNNCILKEPVIPISLCHPDVNYAFSALLAESYDSTNTRIINAYFQILWHRLLPSLTLTDSVQSVVPDLVTNLITYISEHFCEPLSLDILSKELGVCRFYLSRIFTQVLHISFRQYLNTFRINHAKKLLLNNQYKILDVAIQCGFENQQTFNRVFKELCQVTPAAYRKVVK